MLNLNKKREISVISNKYFHAHRAESISSMQRTYNNDTTVMFRSPFHDIILHIIRGSLSLASFCFRYSLTDEGLTLAERLESVERDVKNIPGEDISEGDGRDEEEEERVVDLTESGDDDSDEEEQLPESLSQRATCAIQLSRDAGEGSLQGKPQSTLTSIRKPNRESLLPGAYEILLCVDFIETTG